MTDKIPPSSGEILSEIRGILTAIAREAGRHGVDEIVDLAGRADELVLAVAASNPDGKSVVTC